MAKVYPNSPSTSEAVADNNKEVMTVWRKSLLFNCKGFTAFDSNGNLVFRVDNYSARRKRKIVLMDASGNPMFTIKRKRISIGENWSIYSGEETTNPIYSVTKKATMRQSKTLATVLSTQRSQCYKIEGSYSHRCVTMYDDISNRVIAEIEKKESSQGVGLGSDVFRLVVNWGVDASFAMAIVVLLDQMYG